MKSSRFRSYWLTAAVFVFLFLTGARLPFYDAISLVSANDVLSYLKISEAAPEFPAEPVAFHFAQRFIPHYSAGAFSRLTGLGPEQTYYTFNFLLIAGVLLLCARLLADKARPAGITALLFALAALSPYTFRLNFLVPGMLADMLFLLGLALSLYGLQRKNIAAVFFGVILSVSGKQMALLTLPGIALYAYAVLRERLGALKSAAFCALLAASAAGFNSLLAYWSSGFAAENIITWNVLFGFFPWMVSDRFSAALLLEHLLRTLLPAFPFMILAYVTRRKAGLRMAFSLENAALLLIALGPIAYAFLPGPVLQMHNQSRYTASITLPMALLALNFLPAGEYRLGKKDLLLLVPLLAVYSYHHRYCVLPSSPGVFLAAQLSSMAVFLLWARARIPALAGEAPASGSGVHGQQFLQQADDSKEPRSLAG